MWSVFISLVVGVRAWGRLRPALHLEILALRLLSRAQVSRRARDAQDAVRNLLPLRIL